MTFRNAFCQFWKFKEKENQDIYSVLETVNWIWRGTGVLIVVPDSVGHRKYITNKFLTGYNILLFCLFIISFTDSIVGNYIYTIVKDLGLDIQVNMFIRRSLNWIDMLNVIFWKMITNNKFIEAINSLEKQDRILNNLGCQLNYKSSSIKIGSWVWVYFITTFLFSFHEILYHGPYMMFNWMSWWFPLIIHRTSICLYLCLVWLIGVRFNALNKKIDFVVNSSTSIQPILNTREYISIIRSVANVHAELCKIAKSLNHIFVITLITSALEVFVYLTMILYSLVLEIQGKKNYFVLLSASLLLIVCSIPIITIVMICNWTKKQASLAVTLIYKIKALNDNVLSDLIEIFSMQMLHQKLSFSVGGFFTLDPSLLQSITAVVTSYIIILIQFGQMENILLEKS